MEIGRVGISAYGALNFLSRMASITLSVKEFKRFFFFFFYLGFLSQTFTNHRTAGEGGGHFSNSLLPLPPASQKIGH